MNVNFIKNELFLLSVMGAFQHNKIYKEDINDLEKVKFRNNLKDLLFNIDNLYRKKVTEDGHLSNLDKLKLDIESNNKKILKEGAISFGTVQKILNLYLKYLWSIDLIKEPPHCPIDRIILNKLKDYSTSWTKMDKLTYVDVMAKIKNASGIKSIAQWELNVFNRRSEKI